MSKRNWPSTRCACALAALLPLSAAAQQTAPSAPLRPATTQPVSTRPALRCPVTGRSVDARQAAVARFRGRWVYLADAAARTKFTADPYEYADAVQEQWAAHQPLRVQASCPVTGRPVDGSIYVGEGEAAIYFASEEAKAKWQQDRKPFEPRLAEECFTFQTGCGTCGMPIDPSAVRRVDGRTIYWCCEGCAGELEKSKAEVLRRVDEQIRANRAAWDAQERQREHTGPPESSPAR